MSKRTFKFASAVHRAALTAQGKTQTVRVAVQPSTWDGFAALWPQAGRRAFLLSFVAWQASSALSDAMAGFFVSELVYPEPSGPKISFSAGEGLPFKLLPWQGEVLSNLHISDDSGIKGA